MDGYEWIEGMLEGMIGAAFESIRATVCGSAPEPATAEAALPRRADYDGPKTLDEAVTTAFCCEVSSFTLGVSLAITWVETVSSF